MRPTWMGGPFIPVSTAGEVRVDTLVSVLSVQMLRVKLPEVEVVHGLVVDKTT
jgi:hypothetical protein